MIKYLALFVLTFSLTLSHLGCAKKEDLLFLENRIIHLEEKYKDYAKENETIKETLDKDSEYRSQANHTLRKQFANQQVIIERLRDENQRLNGKLEEISHYQKQIEAKIQNNQKEITRLDQSITNTLTRTVKVEEYLDLRGGPTVSRSDTAASPGLVAVPPPPLPTAQLSETELYAKHKKAFDKGDLTTAREGFEAYLKKYPTSEHADNAQFWIGEIYFKEKWYEKAILEYQKVIEKFPKGNKLPAAYLKQALAFQMLGEKANARLILKELIKKFPDSNETKIAKQKIKTLY